ncbi:Protein kinase domain-containing protein [Mycena sanguinolenta]|uniref:Protein kinase domain-containing protein n=1 Tax=Mycena sanguinolenta TaxID=230812 RepID=A0A8H6YGN7_9AGAR|nr:Protein kinase domain-containing protein [Mycena sanguinolenta]
MVVLITSAMSTLSLPSGPFYLGDTQHDRMNRLLQVLQSDEEIKAIKKLTGADAQTFIDWAQELLEVEGSFLRSSECDIYEKACKLLDALCRTTQKLPIGLFVTEKASTYTKEGFAGAHSTIFSCERHEGLPDFHGTVILKLLRFPDNNENYKKLCREALAWRRLGHPRILEFLGIDNKTFDELHICLLSPFLKNGTIMDYREKMGASNISLDIRIAEIADGVNYIHSQLLVHGDLHPGNILIDNDGRVKIADFGLSAFVNATTTESTGSRRTPDGIITYMAPELLGFKMVDDTAKLRKKSEKTDIFALASVCYTLYRGHHPLHKYTDGAIVRKLYSQPGQDGTTPNPWLGLSQPADPTDAATRSIAMPDSLWVLVRDAWGISLKRPTAAEFLRRLGAI